MRIRAAPPGSIVSRNDRCGAIAPSHVAGVWAIFPVPVGMPHCKLAEQPADLFLHFCIFVDRRGHLQNAENRTQIVGARPDFESIVFTGIDC